MLTHLAGPKGSLFSLFLTWILTEQLLPRSTWVYTIRHSATLPIPAKYLPTLCHSPYAATYLPYAACPPSSLSVTESVRPWNGPSATPLISHPPLAASPPPCSGVLKGSSCTLVVYLDHTFGFLPRPLCPVLLSSAPTSPLPSPHRHEGQHRLRHVGEGTGPLVILVPPAPVAHRRGRCRRPHRAALPRARRRP